MIDLYNADTNVLLGEITEHLLNLLRNAVGSSEGVEVRWQRGAGKTSAARTWRALLALCSRSDACCG